MADVLISDLADGGVLQAGDLMEIERPGSPTESFHIEVIEATSSDAGLMPAADKAKVDHITVTQAVNLDTIETNSNASKTKTDLLAVTGNVDLDAINSRVNELDQAVILKGTWAANAGTFPGSGAAQAGWSYIVSTAGTVNSVTFAVGDRIIAITDNASTSTFASNWFKADYTDQFLSLDGQTGTVTLGALINGLTAKTTPVTNDAFAMMDSAASNASKKFTWGNLRTALDAVYQAAGSYLTSGAIGTTVQAFSNMLSALAGVSSNGLIARTAANTVAARSIAAGTGISVSNGDGAAGNPTISAAAATTTAIGAVELATDAEVSAAATGDKALVAEHLKTAADPLALTDASTIAIDWAARTNFTVILGATGRTLGNPTNGIPGTYRTVRVIGNSTTDFSILFGNQYVNKLPTLTDIDSTRPYILTIYCETTTTFIVSAKKARDI